MSVISLSALDLSLAAGLVLLLALSSWRMKLGVTKSLLIAALRTTLQLLLIGLVLRYIFGAVSAGWIALMALIMLLAAGREIRARQKRRLGGWWSFGSGAMALFISSFSVTLFALVVIIGVDPWYSPQYAIPLLGMLLGNTMTGIALGTNHLLETAWKDRAIIEDRLTLGQTWRQAISDVRLESARSGLIPIINSMAAAGLVSLPGMMTGQILGGNPPLEAVKYQILIMFLIAAGTGFGVVAALAVTTRRLFDARHRLRLDRLQEPSDN